MTDTNSATPVLHPYIAYICSRISTLLELVELESKGQVVKINGFRLKDLTQWRLAEPESLLSNLGSISGFCNAKCEFCYEIGNPLLYEKGTLSLQEAQTRIKYYNANTGIGLIQPKYRLSLEPFTNPNLIKILRSIRASAPDEMIVLTTNGSFLSPQMVDTLAELKPLALVVSINHSVAERRRALMGDSHPEVAIGSLALLQESQIPFEGSIVAWHTIPPGELVSTIKYIDQYHPRCIRVTLPGYSRFFSSDPIFDTDSVWSRIIKTLDEVKPQLHAPLMVVPNLYWNAPIIPIIDGVIWNSPSQIAGLRMGDRVMNINGQPIKTKQQAHGLLAKFHWEIGSCSIEVERKGERILFILVEDDKIDADHYPYKPVGYSIRSENDSGEGGRVSPFGILFSDDIELSAITRMLNTIRDYHAKRVLLLTSQIMEPIYTTLINTVDVFASFFADLEFYMQVPDHTFWGGNILLGDLYTVSDYILSVKNFLENGNDPPDLILIPSSFANRLGYDLLGTSYTIIERTFDIPVELIQCQQIKM